MRVNFDDNGGDDDYDNNRAIYTRKNKTRLT